MKLPTINNHNRIYAIIVGYVIFMLFYFAPTHSTLVTPLPLNFSSLDNHIPFIASSVWIYLTQFILVLAAVWFAKNSQTRTEIYYAAMLTCIFAGLFFFICPTTLPRQTLSTIANSQYAWQFLYASDTDRNCFPSLHVALAILSACMLKDAGTLWRYGSIVWAILIIISTLTTKQHTLLDGTGGIILACFSLFIIRTFTRPHFEPTHDYR